MSITPLVHESLAEIHENKLVDRIVTDILWGRELFQFYGMPSGMTNRQCVSLHSAPGKSQGGHRRSLLRSRPAAACGCLPDKENQMRNPPASQWSIRQTAGI